MNRTANAPFLVVLALGFLPALGCGGGSDNLPPPPPPPPPVPQSAAVTDAGPIAAEVDASAPAQPPVVLAMGTASPDPTPAPTVKVTAPLKGQVITKEKAPAFDIKLDAKNWKTAAGDAHVVLMLDNKPGKVVTDLKTPTKLSELLGGATLEDGQHVLVAYPERANLESVKSPGALAVVDFYVGKKEAPKVDVTKPLVVFNRPTGEYKGDMASHVLVDFLPANAPFGEGKHHARITVTGPGIDGEKTAQVEKVGTAYYLDNLQNGEYTVKLDLLDKDGKAVSGPWSSVSRTFDVAR